MKSTASPTPLPRRPSTRWDLVWPQLLALAILCTLALGVSGCRIAAPKVKSDDKVHANEDIAENREQMRLRARALVQPLCGELVASADQIMAGTTNLAVRRQALLWKIEAVPALREALFLPSPLAAVFDAWVLSIQMTDYFEKGAGKLALGDAHRIAVRTCQQLEGELAQVAASFTLSGDVSKTRAFAQQWAIDHPIRQSIAGRESTLSRAMESQGATSLSTTEAVGKLTVTADDLNRRLEIYSAQVLDQARWQAELFAMDLAAGYQVQQALPLAQSAVTSAGRAVETLDRLAPSVERSLAVVQQAPNLIATERAAAIQAMQAELARAITFVQEERIAALKQLSSERIAAVRDLRDTVVQERKSLSQDLDQMSVKAVDHAFWRAAQLCAVVLAVVFIAIVVLLFLARRLFSARPPAT